MCRATSLTGFLTSKRMSVVFCKSGFFLKFKLRNIAEKEAAHSCSSALQYLIKTTEIWHLSLNLAAIPIHYVCIVIVCSSTPAGNFHRCFIFKFSIVANFLSAVKCLLLFSYVQSVSVWTEMHFPLRLCKNIWCETITRALMLLQQHMSLFVVCINPLTFWPVKTDGVRIFWCSNTGSNLQSNSGRSQTLNGPY